MKVVRLESPTEGPAAVQPSVRIALHPRVTVIVGASAAARRLVLDAIAGIPRGNAPLAGAIEVDGVEADLTAESLARLGLTTDLDVVVAPDDLPSPDGEGSTRALRQAAAAARDEALRSVLAAGEVSQRAHERLDQVQAAVDESREGAGDEAASVQEEAQARIAGHLEAAIIEHRRLDGELERIRGEHDAALSIRTEAEQSVTDARERRQRAVAAATSAAGELEEVRGSADPGSHDALTEAEQRLAALENDAPEEVTTAGSEASEAGQRGQGGQAVPAGGPEDVDADPSAVSRAEESEPVPLVNRIAEMEARRDDLQRRLFALSAPDPAPIRRCLDRVERARAAEPDALQAAPALADSWRDLHLQLAEIEAMETDDERHTRARLEAARQGVADAEAELSVPDLEPDQVAELEVAHASVVAAQKKAGSWLTGVRALNRLEHALAVERRMLDQLGFTTYAAYATSLSTRGLGAAQRAILETARGRLSEAEAAWEALGADAVREERRAELVDQLAAITPDIAALLGHEPIGPEVEPELRALHDGSAVETEFTDLRLALTGAGIVIADGLGLDELVELARKWLEQDDTLAVSREAIEAELRATDDQLVDLWQAQERGEIMAPPDRGESDEPTSAAARRGTDIPLETPEQRRRRSRLAEARSAATAARERVAQHRAVADQIASLDSALADRTAEEHKAAAALGQAERALVDARARVRSLEAQISDVETQQRQLREREPATGQLDPSGTSAAGTEDSVERALAEQQSQLVQAERDVIEAELELERLREDLASAEERLAAAVEADEASGPDEDDSTSAREDLMEEIEWYLLARLAAQRSVGAAGPVPLCLDDPFRDLEVAEAVRLIEHLERMSSVVQLILLSDDQALSFWAESAGEDRAAVVSLAA